MKLLLIAILLFSISLLVFSAIIAGMHGHLLFRPHMTEDWIGWGIVIFTFILGFWFLILFIRKINLNKVKNGD